MKHNSLRYLKYLKILVFYYSNSVNILCLYVEQK